MYIWLHSLLETFLLLHHQPASSLHFSLHLSLHFGFIVFFFQTCNIIIITTILISQPTNNTMSSTTSFTFTNAGRGGYNAPAEDGHSTSPSQPMDFGRGGYNRGPDDDDEEDGRGGYN